MMYLILFVVFILLSIFAGFYVFKRLGKSVLVKKLAGESRLRSVLLRLLPIIPLAVWCFIKPIHALIAIVHLLFFLLVADLIGWIIKKFFHKESRIYWQGVLGLALAVLYLGSGWYFAHHVYETDYAIETAKEIPGGKLRVAVIADAHIGSTFHVDGFAKHMDKIAETNPDLLVIVGDYVDDSTTREDMARCCSALGNLKTTYGVYYVYGNHDEGYMGNRDFTAEDMEAELEKNGVRVLKDEVVEIGDFAYIIGRKDRRYENRMSMEDLTNGLDKARYMIVLDHQPHDFDAQAAVAADLVLCGHTHGGQMFPVGITGELSGENEKTYGLEKRGTTNFIVTSGISDWAIPYKTAAIAEYVIVDIMSK